MIYACVWEDFIPLSLHFDSAEQAINKAKALTELGIKNCRAVSCSETGESKLIILWQPQELQS